MARTTNPRYIEKRNNPMLVHIQPREQNDSNEVIIGLDDIRAADPIRITYCLARDAWIVSKRYEEDIKENKWTDIVAIKGEF